VKQAGHPATSSMCAGHRGRGNLPYLDLAVNQQRASGVSHFSLYTASLYLQVRTKVHVSLS
jgi:hypothetical protein